MTRTSHIRMFMPTCFRTNQDLATDFKIRGADSAAVNNSPNGSLTACAPMGFETRSSNSLAPNYHVEIRRTLWKCPGNQRVRRLIIVNSFPASLN